MSLYDRDMSRFHEGRTVSSVADFRDDSSPVHGIWSIDLGGVPLDLQIEDRGATTTVVFLSAALPAGPRLLPAFTGVGISAELPINCIRISDPALPLVPGLGIGWYAGFEGVDLPAILSSVIRHAQRRMGGKHLALFGASAGGFASLSLGQLLGPVLSIAVNPQTRIEKYDQNAWFAYVKGCHGVADLESARVHLRDNVRSDMVAAYEQGFENSVLYVQNSRDAHMRIHCIPLARAVGPKRNLGFLIGSWGSGHTPPSKTVLRAILQEVGASEGDWGRVLDSRGTHRSVSASALVPLYGK